MACLDVGLGFRVFGSNSANFQNRTGKSLGWALSCMRGGEAGKHFDPKNADTCDLLTHLQRSHLQVKKDRTQFLCPRSGLQPLPQVCRPLPPRRSSRLVPYLTREIRPCDDLVEWLRVVGSCWIQRTKGISTLGAKRPSFPTYKHQSGFGLLECSRGCCWSLVHELLSVSKGRDVGA